MAFGPPTRDGSSTDSSLFYVTFDAERQRDRQFPAIGNFHSDRETRDVIKQRSASTSRRLGLDSDQNLRDGLGRADNLNHTSIASPTSCSCSRSCTFAEPVAGLALPGRPTYWMRCSQGP